MLACPECNRTENQVSFTWGNRTMEVLFTSLDGETKIQHHHVCDDCDDPKTRVHPTCCEVGMRRLVRRDGQWYIDPLPEPITACPWCAATPSF